MGHKLKMVDKMRVIALISCQILALSQAHNGVPVIIWGNSGTQLPSPRAAQATSNKDFLSQYLEPLANQNGHNLVTFVQDKLSLDDITQHGDVYNANSQGGAFHNLKGLVETHRSLSLPSVDHPAESIEKISSKKGVKQHELKSPYDLSSLKLNPEGGNHIKVHLPANDSPAAMRDIDNVIGTVSAALKKLGPSFTAVYTGIRNSLIPQPVYSGRHLLATGEDSGNYTFFNLTADGASCLFFYTKELQFTLRPNTSDPAMANAKSYTWTLPNIQSFDEGSKCGNSSATLKWSYKNNLPENMTSLSAMTTLELLSSGYWKMSAFAVSYDTKIANDTKPNEIEFDDGYMNVTGVDMPLRIRDIWAPQFYSYHCSEFRCSLSTASNVTGQQYIAQVDMDEFQLQFQIKKNQFGMANDCVGFFTIPIWMGLVTTLIMISILSYGLLMLSSINTMDRFDDPKGKTISVPVGE